MTGPKRITIILPSYNDRHIAKTIESIRRFDDINAVKIVVIDGGSDADIQGLIRVSMKEADLFVSEKDEGIFDALNKGLDVCDTEYIGWLGSDDCFTGKVVASDVVAALENADIFMGDIYFVRNGCVTRKTHALPSRLGMMKLGFHNPHYATFGRADLFKSERFELGLRGSDIEYFLRVFQKRPRVVTTPAVVTLQAEGGFSNSSARGIARTNLELVKIFARHTNVLAAVLAVLVKLVYKTSTRTYFAIARKRAQCG